MAADGDAAARSAELLDMHRRPWSRKRVAPTACALLALLHSRPGSKGAPAIEVLAIADR
jgi:hypothetical protein